MAARRIKIEVTYTNTELMVMDCKWNGDTDRAELVLGISPSYIRITNGLINMGVTQSLVDVIFDDLRLYREGDCDKSIDTVRSYIQERTLSEPVARKSIHDTATPIKEGSYSRTRPTRAEEECIARAKEGYGRALNYQRGSKGTILTEFPYLPFTNEETAWCREHAINVIYKTAHSRLLNELRTNGGDATLLRLYETHTMMWHGPTKFINNALAMCFRNNDGELPEYQSILHYGTVLTALNDPVAINPADFLRVNTEKLLTYLADKEFRFDGEVRDYLIHHVTNNGHYDRTLRQRLGQVLKYSF